MSQKILRKYNLYKNNLWDPQTIGDFQYINYIENNLNLDFKHCYVFGNELIGLFKNEKIVFEINFGTIRYDKNHDILLYHILGLNTYDVFVLLKFIIKKYTNKEIYSISSFNFEYLDLEKSMYHDKE